MLEPTSPTAQTLRASQAPFKAKYRADPASALVTLTSTGRLSSTSIACKVSSGASSAKIAGLHPAAGGPDPILSGEVCAGDMLLDALVACAGVTLKAVATTLDLPLLDAHVQADGDLDLRGTLGIDRTASVGFKAIRSRFDCTFEIAVAEADMSSLLELTERHCIVLQTITRKPSLTATATSISPAGNLLVTREL